MKKVFSNADQTIHVWAQQTQDEGRSKNCYFEGNTVYSYGNHYPLGIFIKNDKGETAVILNVAGYSHTTNSHISAARSATRHITNKLFLYNTDAMKAIVYKHRYGTLDKKSVQQVLSEAIIKRLEHYEFELRSDTKKRRAATLEDWKNDALSRCDSYIEIMTFFATKPNAAANKKLASVTGVSPDKAKEHAVKAAASEARKRAIAEKKRIAERAVKRAEAVKLFLAGENLYNGNIRNDLYDHETILLRVKGEIIQTSRGAEFPVKHALKALPAIRACRTEGKEWHTNGHTIHLGDFHIDTITPDGTVIAGCHTVPYTEIERVAKELGV